MKRAGSSWVPVMTLSVDELLQVVTLEAGGAPRARVAEALGTSRSQASRLLEARGTPLWSTIERLVQALGAMQGKTLRVQLVLESHEPSETSQQESRG